jgi:hypothetical protein
MKQICQQSLICISNETGSILVAYVYQVRMLRIQKSHSMLRALADSTYGVPSHLVTPIALIQGSKHGQRYFATFNVDRKQLLAVVR